jgi:hypothetical protein
MTKSLAEEIAHLIVENLNEDQTNALDVAHLIMEKHDTDTEIAELCYDIERHLETIGRLRRALETLARAIERGVLISGDGYADDSWSALQLIRTALHQQASSN